MHRLYHILLFLLPMISVGQNLVPNGGFENHSFCPTAGSGLNACNNWSYAISTANYFHFCGAAGAGVHNNLFGSQTPIDSAYIGLASYYTGFAGNQEVAVAELLEPLTSGGKYRVRFKASYADTANFAVCCVGAYISSTAPPSPPFTQNLSSVELVLQESDFDTSSWFQFDGVYTAQGGEDKIYLGTFRPEANLNPVNVRPNGDSNYDIAYFFVDDVEVYEDETVSVVEPDFTFSIYPNPATTNLTIESRTPLAQVWVRDVAGRALRYTTLPRGTQGDHTTIDVSNLPSGIYLVEVLTQNGQRSVQKVVVE